MGPRRVAVTGVGVVSAIGCDRRTFWQALVEGRHGFRNITLADTSGLQFRSGAEIQGLDLDAPFEAGSRDVLDRFARFFLLAAREAVAASGLEKDSLQDAAVVTGSSLGGQTSQDELFAQLYREGRRRITPLAVPRTMTNAGASQSSMELGIGGPGLTLSTACASATHAIGLAYWMVSRGMVDVALAGGSEAPFSLGHLKAWEGLRVVSPDLCRPFSRGRKGLVLGEGGGALVLESHDHARARGAEVLGEMIGFGMSSDASHVTKPSAAGAARALRAALRDAEIDAEDVSYINAHGTGTALNDAVESEAIENVFGDAARRVMVSSTKSMHGHALGASGALEAVATVLSIRESVVPPTANFLEPDPDCRLDCVPNEARPSRLPIALSSSFAFGGLNGVLVFASRDRR